ncbi:MAG: TIGR03936 family radical SAM-associated protein [Acidimicrobiales bacterium]
MTRVRFRFAKIGRVRFTSHRDVARMWERALRRARLPVAYSAGFSPRPLLSFGLALPTGCESLAEYVDVGFAAPVDPQGLADMIGVGMPEGVSVVALAPVEPNAPSLQQAVTSCSWEIAVPGVDAESLHDMIGRALGAAHLPVQVERKGRIEQADLRPSVVSLSVSAPAAGDENGLPVLVAELATRPRGVRPRELAEALELELGAARRTSQWIEHDGTRREPLDIGAPVAFPAMGRAS